MAHPYPTTVKQRGQLAKYKRPGKGSHKRHLSEGDGIEESALEEFKRTYCRGLYAASLMPQKDEQDYLTGRS